jgi:hypothetical protein
MLLHALQDAYTVWYKHSKNPIVIIPPENLLNSVANQHLSSCMKFGGKIYQVKGNQQQKVNVVNLNINCLRN